MSGLSTQFTSISEDLTCPPECRKSYVLTILGEDPIILGPTQLVYYLGHTLVKYLYNWPLSVSVDPSFIICSAI